jgi:GT2 family glycosyltransferase
MDSNPKVGALTVRVNLANGDIDPASHRGFPTVWRSLTYFVGLENATRSIPVLSGLFGGYHLTSYNLATKHQIDAGTGAFLLTRKSLMDTLKGFDESFFMYGEDIDLTLREQNENMIIKVMHRIAPHLANEQIRISLKEFPGLKYRKEIMSSQNEETRKRTRTHFHDAMKLFYRKHYEKIYPVFVNRFIYYMIDLKNSLS